jgi:hypothetical protein
MKLAQALNPRATHGNTLVMRRSLHDDEDPSADVLAAEQDHRRRARYVPDRPVNEGNSRSLTDSLINRLTCGQAG